MSVSHILSKLEHAYLHDSSGLTIAELLQDTKLSDYTPERLQSVLNALEDDKLVKAEMVDDRGLQALRIARWR